MTIQAVLFDLDGVLVDACGWHYESLNMALMAVASIEISLSEHMSTFNGLPTTEKLRILKDQGRLQDIQFDKIWQLKQKNTVSVISDLAKVDKNKIYLHTMLNEMGIKVACVTNSIRETAELMLTNTGQIDLMEFLITNEDVKNNKPHSEPYIRAMIRLGINPENILIVEDSDKGMASAMGTGAHVLRVKDAEDVTWKKIIDIISRIQ
jgi:HAD superfamily hydrolase (TIGR01509 family)